MAKGYDQHQERLAALNLLGKDLSRRAKSHCELCSAGGVSLRIFEVAPIPAEPDVDHCLMLCETCIAQLAPRGRLNAPHWHCLETAAWSETPVIQVMAVRILRQLPDERWAADLLEGLYLFPEAKLWLESSA